ncbi:MAG: hypothetical protein ABI846_12450, partial [Rudaea sp.]
MSSAQLSLPAIHPSRRENIDFRTGVRDRRRYLRQADRLARRSGAPSALSRFSMRLANKDQRNPVSLRAMTMRWISLVP